MSYSYNKDFIDVLNKVKSIKMKEGDVFKARAYEKAKDYIILNNKPIKDIAELEHVKKIGKSTFNILKEFCDTGTVTMIEKAKNNPFYTLSDIFGIGPKKAKQLVSTHKITSIDHLRQNQELLNKRRIVLSVSKINFLSIILYRIQHLFFFVKENRHSM